MSNSTTIVTALYDIGREKLTGSCAKRSFTKYLDWFKNLLSINAPMIIFTSADLKQYILEHRPQKYLTTIVIRRFEDLDAYKYYDRIQGTINRMVLEPDSTGKIPHYFKECPEFITAKYEVIIFSKFDFLREVAAKNPYGTEYFIWLDAGTFYDKPPFDTTLVWPDEYKIKILGDKFLICVYNEFNKQDNSILVNKREFLRKNENKICAFMLGGNKTIIDKVHKDFWEEVDLALDSEVINNEQNILNLMVVSNPDDYYVWSPTCERYPRLPTPVRDRMIPYELSIGSKTGETYPKNNNLKLLTLSTLEIDSNKYQKWETSAKYFGYNYEILCRDKKWEGFGMKIREYYNRLREITEEYCVLTDSNDGFFCGPPEELLQRFLGLNVDCIVGSEMYMAYPNGRYDKDVIKSYFTEIKESEQIFPNSGFIMGKTANVIALFERNLHYIDDQAACFDAIYEGFSLAIDYNTTLVGNVPNYHENNHLAIDYFSFDDKYKRYRNIHNGEMPIFLHFAGGNWIPMIDFYNNVFSQDVPTQNVDTSNSIWVFLAIIIIVIILVIVAIRTGNF